MKTPFKILMALAFLIVLAAVPQKPQAQTYSTTYALTASSTGALAYVDTLTDAATKNYTLTRTIDGGKYWAVQVYFDHLSGASDSCKCKVSASYDGTNYNTIPGYAQGIQSTWCSYLPLGTWLNDKFSTTDASYIFYGSGYFPGKYARVTCQHWATGTARVKVLLHLYTPVVITK